MVMVFSSEGSDEEDAGNVDAVRDGNAMSTDEIEVNACLVVYDDDEEWLQEA